MLMDGIPFWMAAGGVGLIILLTHFYFVFRTTPARGPGAYWRFNLFRARWLRRWVGRSWFPLAAQSLSLGLFLAVIVAGLWGAEKHNLAPVLTWTWWWILLVFFVVAFGKLFCAVCPWEALSSLVTSLSAQSRVKRLAYDRPFPKWARNIWPALGGFVLLTWLELGLGLTHWPTMTAVLGLVMAALAVTMAVVYEKRAFCRYTCPVGRISGLYALFSPVVRPASALVCHECTGKECLHGTATATGCPTHLFPGHLTENTYCTLCTECVRACPHDNIALNLRPPGTDLFRKDRFQWDEAVLAIVLLALTSFHGLTMTPMWVDWNHTLRADTGLGPKAVFTVLMALMVAAPVGLFWLAARTAAGLNEATGVTTARVFKGFACAVIPVALFYHLAHNVMHFFMEAGTIVPLLSDPLGHGWDLFGTANLTVGPLLSMNAVWWIQILCILIGHLFSVAAADRLARRLYASPRAARTALIPFLIVMVFYSLLSTWLIAQPMDMRVSGM